jgi:SAM-dependent methyltransferase
MTKKPHPPARASAARPFLAHAERRILAHLHPRGGGRYLDVGCGTGADAADLAARVRPGGLVLGLDVTGAAFAATRHGAISLPVAFLLGDARALPFPNAAFDGARAKRVLHHVPDPAQAVAEMARVTRPGGHVVALEPDWGTAAVHGADRDLTRAVLAHWCTTRLHGWMGRALPALFRGAGLIDIRVEALTEQTTTRGTAEEGLWEWLVRRAGERALGDGILSAREVARWQAELEEAERAGRFFACLTYVLVSGRRPASP